MRVLLTISLLCISNIFMTLAWYGHLKFREMEWSKGLGLFAIILISWGIAMFEYMFQVPANKFGFKGNGGPFSLLELKMIQEALSIGIFLIFTLFFFKNEKIAWNHLVGFGFLVLAVYFVFLKK
ncbi:DMT family protein [Daejeonella sp. H1SJ63]|uniref:DMT family protein n=1 Tax=Daejeonella sp. H1SJ63 TaxID=3034145 RepID=UPI0023EB4AA2|nr:DMT family protein [Daejeonella sp. H1SJ63]